MKVIVYTSNDNGIDGREPTYILQASLYEEKRDEMIAADKSKAWRSKGEIVVDLEVVRKRALTKLDGLDRLALGLPQRFTEGS